MNHINLDKLTLNDLAEKHREVAEIVGLHPYIELCGQYGGTAIYIPTAKDLSKHYVYQRIKESKDLFSREELARIYGISTTTVYRILRGDCDCFLEPVVK